MKILVLIPFAFYQPSGSSHNAYQQLKIIASLSENCDVITYPHGKDFDGNNINIIRAKKLRVFKNYQPGEWKKKIFYDFTMFLLYLWKISFNKYDIVIAHASSAYWSIWFKYFLKAKFIANIHGNVEGEFEKWNISKIHFIKNIFKILESKIINRFDKIIVIHKSTMDKFVLRGLEKSKIELIYNSVEDKSIEIKKLDSLSFIVLYTGTFVAIQNLELLYRSAQCLQDDNIFFILIGGTEKEISKERIKVKELSVEKYFEFFIRKSPDELEKYYESANIVVSPRVYGDDTPMKIYDYLNYGKCILATDTRIHHGILNEDIAKLVEPTPEKFASALIELKNNPNKIFSYAKKAKEYYSNNFNFEIQKMKYKNLFDKLINND